MKLIKGQYVRPSGTTIAIERHDNTITPRISISVNLNARLHVPVEMYLRADRVRRLDLLQPVIELIWGGPMASVYNSSHRQDVLNFTELVEEYCK